MYDDSLETSGECDCFVLILDLSSYNGLQIPESDNEGQCNAKV